MELFEASKIPFATIADYLRDPEAYDAGGELAAGDPGRRRRGGSPRPSHSSRTTSGPRASRVEDAPVVTRALEAFAFAVRARRRGAAARGPRPTRGRAAGGGRPPASAGRSQNRALIAECRPWIEAFDSAPRPSGASPALAAEGRLEATRSAELRAVPRGAPPPPRARLRGCPRHDPRRPHRVHHVPAEERLTASRRPGGGSMTEPSRRVARRPVATAAIIAALAGCSGSSRRRPRRPGPADRDGLARRGADPRSGTTSRAVRGRASRRQGRDELHGRRPLPDHRAAAAAQRPQRAGHLLRVDRRAPPAAQRGRVRGRPQRGRRLRARSRGCSTTRSSARRPSTARS